VKRWWRNKAMFWSGYIIGRYLTVAQVEWLASKRT